ncbi:MAG: hypothetical protein Q9P14_17820 [candidate division KSB1 bacterium]|nr:hypothetical protein [candidate division KSB1 bacterium]
MREAVILSCGEDAGYFIVLFFLQYGSAWWKKNANRKAHPPNFLHLNEILAKIKIQNLAPRSIIPAATQDLT